MSAATITLLFLLFAVVMFVFEKIPLGVTSMIVCIGLVVTGVLDVKTEGKNVRSPSALEIARFFAEGGGGRFSCILLFVWRAQKLVHNPCNTTKLEKRD